MTEAQLRALVGDWPGVSSDIKWQDDLVFMVAGRMFCVFCLRGAHAGTLSFKVEDERFLEFTDRPGFHPAPYLARARWVKLDHPDAHDADELRGLIRRAYEIIRAKLPKKTQRELGD